MVYDKSILKKLHTKQLMKLYKIFRANRNSVIQYEACCTSDIPENRFNVSLTVLNGPYETSRCNITLADVREELALRPHVPNKAESKQLRKEKHARGKNRGRKDKLCRLHTHLSGLCSTITYRNDMVSFCVFIINDFNILKYLKIPFCILLFQEN